MTIEPLPGEVYLGDGLYARFDGFQVWLRAPRFNMDHEVALEPETMVSFQRFITALVERYPELAARGWR